jgi:hypothetical protein
MCVIVAKKLPIGPNGEKIWVVGKNRDRNYIPPIKFTKYTNSKNHVEYRAFIDGKTTWAEGVNSAGIAIVNSALMVVDDENDGGKGDKDVKDVKTKEGDKGKGKNSKSGHHDGKIIKKVLKQRNIDKILKEIIYSDVMGFTFVTNGKQLFVVENVKKYDAEEKTSKGKRYTIEHSTHWFEVKDPEIECVVRSNHGEIFSDTGYLMGTEPGKSSRRRKSSVEDCVKKDEPKTVKDLFHCMSVEYEKNPEMNPVRLRKKGCKIFTTGQYIIDPVAKSMYYRPIDCELFVNDEKVKPKDFDPKEGKTNLYVVNNIDDVDNKLEESINFKIYCKNPKTFTI